MILYFSQKYVIIVFMTKILNNTEFGSTGCIVGVQNDIIQSSNRFGSHTIEHNKD